MDSDMKLKIEIKNSRPVELTDLTSSLNSLADEYKRQLAIKESNVDSENIKLYVKEIKSGSIITELVALAPYALPFVDNAKTILEYAEYLKGWYEFLIGKGEQPAPAEKRTLQNLTEILEPIAKDNGSQINIGALNIQGDVVVTLNMDYMQANAAQNFARRKLDELKEPVTGKHSKVLMYWWQARNEIGSKSGDRAKIESLFDGAVKVEFDNDAIKHAMLLEEPHPFKKAFVVDVTVETVGGKPALYKVTKLHESFDL